MPVTKNPKRPTPHKAPNTLVMIPNTRLHTNIISVVASTNSMTKAIIGALFIRLSHISYFLSKLRFFLLILISLGISHTPIQYIYIRCSSPTRRGLFSVYIVFFATFLKNPKITMKLSCVFLIFQLPVSNYPIFC